MTDYNKVIEGIIAYMDAEVLTQMTGPNKWILGAGCGIASRKAQNLFNSYKDHKLLQSLDLIKGNEINVDLLHEVVREQALKEKIVIDIPMLGSLKLDANDIDKMRDYIKRR